jgi:23S rRNA (cytosine1962-C5)-methyltransferase
MAHAPCFVGGILDVRVCDSSAMGRQAELVLTMAAADSVRRGHPWVWDKGVTRGATGLVAGAEVKLLASNGEAIGRGVYEPGSPIAVRVWSTDGEASLDVEHLRKKLEHAFGIRAKLFPGEETTAYRLLHGEGDRVPGVVIDRYGPAGIVRMDGPAAEATALRLRSTLVEQLYRVGVKDVAVRRTEKGASPTFEVWAGGEPPATIIVREHGVPFVVDLRRGQKTGAFLDQRENRRRVGAMAKGKRVLNLFSYAGGFSLHAAIGGASHVTSVDIAAQAHGTAQASFRAAGVDARAHEFASADVFAFLEGARARGETWDLVISDPPSFAPNEKSRPRALAAYRTLHKAAAHVLAPGGTLCAASCSSHVDAEAFLSTLDDASLGTRHLSLLELHGPPADHPTLGGWPEGRYLKFAVLA